MSIILQNVSHTYMADTSLAQSAISDINLTINENEFIAIIGHTGSGKSTLVSHMNGLIQPTSGKVFVDGLDMSDKSKRKLGRAAVGMAFQYPEHQLFEETVAKDIAFGPKNMGLDDEEIGVRVRESMELVGLDFLTFANKSPFDLSGGEKRRAALAGIIAMRPKYLVLDEPMAGLDPMGRRTVISTVFRLKEALKCTIIIVSHSMDDVARVAERIIVMNNGKIAMDGKPKDIFSNADKLIEIGLGLPQALSLAHALRQRGIDVPEGIYTMDAMQEFLERRLGLC